MYMSINCVLYASYYTNCDLAICSFRLLSTLLEIGDIVRKRAQSVTAFDSLVLNAINAFIHYFSLKKNHFSLKKNHFSLKRIHFSLNKNHFSLKTNSE